MNRVEKIKKFCRNPKFIFRKVAGEAVLIPLTKEVADLEAIYSLNDVGVFIWEQMSEPISLEELKNRIIAEFEVDESVVMDDLSQFTAELLDSGVISED